ncbi:DUF6349 family protein [Streptomyces lonarensis]|uniref:Uncharacterized protein n=1 Tax=Streptomyces lonarensis TaxID=700599 RepID=A0A7X6CWP3_9ACTN|nr:DUF6349 family protein [Streptomyces lonarensis]NJQ04007.1 hypothetical protein [Streptomyces lonarensis]
MTATDAEPTGARARQTYYWRVRNARTRHRPESSAHRWHIQPGHPGGAYSDLGHELEPPAHHAPTLLSRSRPKPRGHEQQFRGGCLTCAWEGPVYPGSGHGDGDNSAIEDAHDHAFPGWRELPPITRARDRRQTQRNLTRWTQLTSQYPLGWVDQGAPILVWSRHRREPHLPPHRGSPRYELRVDRPPTHRDKRATDQDSLF